MFRPHEPVGSLIPWEAGTQSHTTICAFWPWIPGIAREDGRSP
jgi:hypothetical protein